MRIFRVFVILGVGVALVLARPVTTWSQTVATQGDRRAAMDGENPIGTHRVVIQVTQNDPAVMTMALNNVENLVKAYQAKGEKIEVEIVAYGAGLNLVRDDTSPVKDRLASIAGTMKNVKISGCGNTLGAQSKLESKAISLIPDARIVPSGIARIVELQEQGWTYVRP